MPLVAHAVFLCMYLIPFICVFSVCLAVSSVCVFLLMFVCATLLILLKYVYIYMCVSSLSCLCGVLLVVYFWCVSVSCLSYVACYFCMFGAFCVCACLFSGIRVCVCALALVFYPVLVADVLLCLVCSCVRVVLAIVYLRSPCAICVYVSLCSSCLIGVVVFCVTRRVFFTVCTCLCV